MVRKHLQAALIPYLIFQAALLITTFYLEFYLELSESESFTLICYLQILIHLGFGLALIIAGTGGMIHDWFKRN